MACLTKDNRLVWTCSITKKVRKITLGDMPRKEAKAFLEKIEPMIRAAEAGRPAEPAWVEWAKERDPRHLAALVKYRLVEESAAVRSDLKGFIEGFVKVRGPQVGASANNHYRQAKDRALAYFKANPDIRKISVGEAMAFHSWLISDCGLKSNSASKRCATLRAMFQFAVDSDLIVKNPWADKRVRKAVTPAADDRRFFLAHKDAVKVLEACGDDRQIAAIFALCRWGGLRVGETLLLKWEHVDLKADRLTILSPKTANQGKDRRVMPLFPEVKRALLALPTDKRKSKDLLVPKYAGKTTQWAGFALSAAIKKTDVKEWVRLWQNLRSTRATELADAFPSYLCAQWLGHTEAVANANYRRATDEHYSAGAAFETGGASKRAAPDVCDERQDGAAEAAQIEFQPLRTFKGV